MDDDGDTSDGEGGRIAMMQRQARRRMVNARHAPHESIETTTSLPEYTSSPPDTPAMQKSVSATTNKIESPPGYPQLTAEEADEERDEVGDVVRRVRVRRRRSSGGSGSDPYLDSLLARSVHALELSNALLQSSMTTHSSLSALLSHDDLAIDRSLDSHARFLAGQIHASDSRRAWVDDIARQVDSLDHPPLSPLGLSQSLPDSPTIFYDRMRAARDDVLQARPRRKDGGLQQGDRPRSPPPRCMTQYTTAEAYTGSDDPDSILIPSTNGLRAAARLHGFVPLGADNKSHSRRSSGSRNHSRRSSVEWSVRQDEDAEGDEDGMFARQQLGWGRGSGTPVSPRSASAVHSPRRSLSLYTHSPHTSTSSQASVPGFGVYQHGNMSSPQLQSSPRRTRGQLPQSQLQQVSSQQYASHQPSTPVQPVLSAVPAAPSTPAYNLLSAIATRSPSGNSSDGGGTVRARGGSLSIADLTNSMRTTTQSDLGAGARARGDSGTFVQRGPGIGLGLGRASTGSRRTRSVTPSSRGNTVPTVVSPLKRKADAGGMRMGTATPPHSKSSDSPLKSAMYSPVGGTSSPSRPKAGMLPGTGTGTSSPVKSKPPSRSGSSMSVSSPAHSTPVSSPSTSRLGSMSSPGHVRHPFLQPEPHRRRNPISNSTQSEGEEGGRLHKYRSADALRKILDAAKAAASEDEHADADEDGDEEDDERGRGTVRVSDIARGKQRAATESNPQNARNGRSKTRPPLPTWSVIPRTVTTVAVEVVTPGGVVSIKGINGGVGASMTGSGSGSGSRARTIQKLDPLELPGEFDTRGATSPIPVSATKSLASPARSRSVGPPSRLSTLLSASLPKIPVFGKTSIPGEPPPAIDETNRAEIEEDRPKLESHPGNGSTVAATATLSDKLYSEPIDGLPSALKDEGGSGVDRLPNRPLSLSLQLNGTAMDPDLAEDSTPPNGSAASDGGSDTDSEPSHASLPLSNRMFDSTQLNHRPSSLRLPGSPRPSSLKQPGSGASTPRSVKFSPLPPKHISSSGRSLSEARTRRKKDKEKGKEKEKPGWFASWFGPLPSAGAGTAGGASKAGYGVARRGWDNPRGMDDWQM